MSKLFKLMIAVGLIAVMLMASNGGFVWAADEPTYVASGTTSVDGDYGEWNLAEGGTGDWFSNMTRAEAGVDVLSKLYLRYECSSKTLYALVLVPQDLFDQGFYIDTASGSGEHYLKVGGKGNKVDDTDQPPDGTVPDFEWIGLSGNTARGWEASAYVLEGAYTDLRVHTNVYDPNKQESETSGTGEIELLLDCGPTAISLSSFAAKSGAGGSTNWLWLGLAGLVLAAGGLFWAKRRVG